MLHVHDILPNSSNDTVQFSTGHRSPRRKLGEGVEGEEVRERGDQKGRRRGGPRRVERGPEAWKRSRRLERRVDKAEVEQTDGKAQKGGRAEKPEEWRGGGTTRTLETGKQEGPEKCKWEGRQKLRWGEKGGGEGQERWNGKGEGQKVGRAQMCFFLPASFFLLSRGSSCGPGWEEEKEDNRTGRNPKELGASGSCPKPCGTQTQREGCRIRKRNTIKM